MNTKKVDVLQYYCEKDIFYYWLRKMGQLAIKNLDIIYNSSHPLKKIHLFECFLWFLIWKTIKLLLKQF